MKQCELLKYFRNDHGVCLIGEFISKNSLNTVSGIISSPKPSDSQGELIVYSCSGIHRQNRLTNQKPNFM